MRRRTYSHAPWALERARRINPRRRTCAAGTGRLAEEAPRTGAHVEPETEDDGSAAISSGPLAFQFLRRWPCAPHATPTSASARPRSSPRPRQGHLGAVRLGSRGVWTAFPMAFLRRAAAAATASAGEIYFQKNNINAVHSLGLFCRFQTLIPAARTFSLTQRLDEVSDLVWHLGRLNHVAIAVPDLEKASAFYKNVLGAQVSHTIPLPEHGVSVVFVNLGNTKLELLHPSGSNSPIAGFLQKNKAGGMHHICIEVDNINEAVMDLKKKKIRSLTEEATIGAHGKPVIFLHPKDCGGVLVELEQA
ncbi:PREDICTED: methylmalonyl-CoA epimerase, mitochondrial-like [Elephantulus edwardii]|uniref:methylmalonyl-CoA epimerase, mitochondrial-like n=1 Tax=Elephantulus edwardii TaxID=28737 RepID=UPI0003F07C33|nr:PREDICTED: methylmalonyl-CoA epimerase, mitochondrial-like [Elephantulus edwardii]